MRFFFVFLVSSSSSSSSSYPSIFRLLGSFPSGFVASHSFYYCIIVSSCAALRYSISALRSVTLATSNDFYARSQNCEKRLLAPLYLSVRLSVLPYGKFRLLQELNFVMGAGNFMYLVGSLLST
jgi:hypothetical protein